MLHQNMDKMAGRQLKMGPIWPNVDVESDTDLAGLSNAEGIQSDCPGSSHLMANHCMLCKMLNDAASLVWDCITSCPLCVNGTSSILFQVNKP